MFISAVLWGIYTSMAKRVATYDPLQVTAGIVGAGAVMLVPLAAFEVGAEGMPSVDLQGWLGMAYLGAGASGVAYLMYSAALKHVDASEAGVYTNLIPIVGVITGMHAGRPAVGARDHRRRRGAGGRVAHEPPAGTCFPATYVDSTLMSSISLSGILK